VTDWTRTEFEGATRWRVVVPAAFDREQTNCGRLLAIERISREISSKRLSDDCAASESAEQKNTLRLQGKATTYFEIDIEPLTKRTTALRVETVIVSRAALGRIVPSGQRADSTRSRINGAGLEIEDSPYSPAGKHDWGSSSKRRRLGSVWRLTRPRWRYDRRRYRTVKAGHRTGRSLSKANEHGINKKARVEGLREDRSSGTRPTRP